MEHRVCPWWLGYLLAGPLRRLFCDPVKMLSPYLRESDVVLDVGCGMGFFSLTIATLVGGTGKVICVDLQQKMIEGLIRRARKAHLSELIDPRVCSGESLIIDDLTEMVDFVLAFAVLHEVPDKERLLSEIGRAMKRDGKLLIAEPSGHVKRSEFEQTVQTVLKAGFEALDVPVIRRSRAVLFTRK